MRLSSSAFPDGGEIPRRFTCDGEDVSPPLAWTDVPPGARSLVLLCDDPDAGTIPADRIGFADSDAGKLGFTQAINDFHRRDYNGPCPPRWHGPHHYHFRLLALSTSSLPLRDEPTCRDVEQEARKHVLSEATLVGVYQR